MIILCFVILQKMHLFSLHLLLDLEVKQLYPHILLISKYIFFSFFFCLQFYSHLLILYLHFISAVFPNCHNWSPPVNWRGTYLLSIHHIWHSHDDAQGFAWGIHCGFHQPILGYNQSVPLHPPHYWWKS